MDVFVFGVGRSGTTMMYRLVQQAFLHKFGQHFQSTYEPFIWNRTLFDGIYENVLTHFGKTASISIEGIYQHLALPLFFGATDEQQVSGNKFLDHFSVRRQSAHAHVAKLIRANGRMRLFRYLNPSAKFILMVRNPVDVINSVKYKFSFFGEDFYPSDYPRFCRELAGDIIMHPANATWARKNAEYVYQMNRAALEFSANDERTLILEYDQYMGNRSCGAAAVCDFIGINCTQAILDAAMASKGPVTRSIALSGTEFSEALPYADLHQKMCKTFRVSTSFSVDKVASRYRGACNQPDIDTSYEGLTTNQLRRIVLEQKQELARLKRLCDTHD